MKRLIESILLISILACCCISCRCKETVNENLQVLIQNGTESTIHVRLYPKVKSGQLYPICEGCGSKKMTEFTLYSPNWNEVIFTAGNLDIEPYTLAAKAFDSIYISFTNKNNIIIRFTPETVTGYVENIFTENSTWTFRIEEWNRHTQFCPNPQRDCRYSFIISEDKILLNE